MIAFGAGTSCTTTPGASLENGPCDRIGWAYRVGVGVEVVLAILAVVRVAIGDRRHVRRAVRGMGAASIVCVVVVLAVSATANPEPRTVRTGY
jgi:hypothetical protein